MDLHISHFSDLLKLQAQNPKKTQISKPKLETGSDLGDGLPFPAVLANTILAKKLRILMLGFPLSPEFLIRNKR